MLLVWLLLPLLAATDTPYREALPGYAYSFPRDHFAHPEFRTEWWYYTGNVWSKDGHRFGFELVFFRQGKRIGSRDNASAWRIDDVYFAHAALTDVDGHHFTWHERLNRAGPGIAGASLSDARIWNGNWSDQWSGDRQTLSALTQDFSFQLDCSPAKPLVIHGENGVSQKAAEPGRASHYISFPKLNVTGTVQTSGKSYPVSGQAWMDHEWFTHQLADDQTGWDWFSVQLENGTELMLFELRRKDGVIDPFSSGTFIARDGRSQHLTSAEFTLKPLTYWGKYPVAWAIEIPGLNLHLECRAALRNQEVAASQGPKYWEGAVDYSGSERGKGYLEMTGYDAPMRLR